MKRADLTVGQEYLVHDSNDWNTGKPWGSPERYRLLSLDKVAEQTYRYSGYRDEAKPFTIDVDGITYAVKRARRATHGDKHQHAIMVRLENNTGRVVGSGTAVLVLFGKIRAPWTEGKAILDEVDRKRQEAQARTTAALQERTIRAQAVADRAALIGVRVPTYVTATSTVAVSLDSLEQLLTLAEKAVHL